MDQWIYQWREVGIISTSTLQADINLPSFKTCFTVSFFSSRLIQNKFDRWHQYIWHLAVNEQLNLVKHIKSVWRMREQKRMPALRWHLSLVDALLSQLEYSPSICQGNFVHLKLVFVHVSTPAKTRRDKKAGLKNSTIFKNSFSFMVERKGKTSVLLH